MLGRGVRSEPGESDQPRDRGKIYDRAAAILHHPINLVFEAEVSALGIHRHDLVEILFRLFGERNDSAFDTGVVARAVQSPKGRYGFCDQGLDLRSLGYICSNKSCVARLLSDESNRFAASIAVQIGDNNLGTLFCKFERGGTANPCPRPSHKSYLPRHKAHWLSRRPNIQNSYSRAGFGGPMDMNMTVTAHDESRAQPSRNGLAGLAGPQTAADVAGRFFGDDRRLDSLFDRGGRRLERIGLP